MRPLTALLITALNLILAVAEAAVFKIGAHNFTLPAGFAIEPVVPTNLVPRPIEGDFDEQGRLYVTDSSGSNDKVETQLAEKPHRVVRLEDTDGDGQFDKSIVFADRMMLPQGALWFDGSLYVAAPPSIWKLTDTNQDGVADVRVEWFQGKTLTGCANDLHGPYAGPDGWIYWCKGAFAKQTYTLPNGREFITRASHLFRARPDGSSVEPVMTGGMDNPVGLAFTPEGERILSGTFFQNPEGGKRDGLIHALYGGVYGKGNEVLDGHVRTGELLPIMTHLGPAAPAGLMRYESPAFGKEFEGNLFAACFNLHKVTRHILQAGGGTYKTLDSDFLVSDNPDFHPTDVFEDADGSLIVIDTGGWYKLCCPTSQLHKPDVLGGIYRVRRSDAARIDDPRGLKIDWRALRPRQLASLLDDARPEVYQRAVSELARRGDESVPALAEFLEERPLSHSSVNAVWALARIPGEPANEPLRKLLEAPSGVARVQEAALNSLALRRDSNAVPVLIRKISNGYPAAARLAIEAVGRIGDRSAVPALLAAAYPLARERSLEHALVYALVEMGDPAGTAAGLKSKEGWAQRVALLALDQMPNGNLKAGTLMPFLRSEHRIVSDAALWIAARHPEWGNELTGFFRERLASSNLTDDQRVELQRQLARFAGSSSIQELIAETLTSPEKNPDSHWSALQAMIAGGLKDLPASWSKALISVLAGSNARLVPLAITAARSSRTVSPDLSAALLRAGRDPALPRAVRLEAVAAAASGPARLDAATFDFVRSHVAPTNPVAARSSAALVLGRTILTPEQLELLTGNVRTAGPMELPKLIKAYASSRDERLGLSLISALQATPAATSLRPELVHPYLTNFPISVRQRADELLATLNTDTAQQKKHLEELLAATRDGDVRRGQGIFNSPKAACSACHAIGYLGGKIGPDLTRIGQVRNERDLLEALVYPSASFVRSFEPTIIATRGGDEYSGVLRKDAPDEVVLATGPDTEQRIPRNDILDMRPGAVSVMPSGLTDQFTKQELADLLAFLKATRW